MAEQTESKTSQEAQDHPSWLKFRQWAESDGVDFGHKDDWLPHWKSWLVAWNDGREDGYADGVSETLAEEIEARERPDGTVGY